MLAKLLFVSFLLCGLSASLAEDVVTVTGSNFEEVVKEGTPVVLEFYAPWCGHCKKLAPEYEKAAGKLKEAELNVVLAKCDATEADNKDLASKYGVRGYPTIKIFKNGSEEDPIEYAGPRDSEGIASYLSKVLGPASAELKSSDAVEKFFGEGTKLLGVFENDEAPEFEVFVKVADAEREGVTASHTFDKESVKECGEKKCEGPTVILSIPEDGVMEFYEGDFEVEALGTWVKKTSAPKLPELGQNPRMRATLQRIFKNDFPRFFAFTTKDYPQLEALKTELITLNEEHENVDVMIVDFGENARAAQFFALTEKDAPALVIHDHKNNAKYIKKSAEPSHVQEFLKNFHGGELEPDVKSEDPPTKNDGPVRVVVGKTFKEEVMESGKNVLIEFYAPWCGHCKKLTPVYEKVGEHFKDNESVVIAKIDATANDIPDGKFQVRGYPTLKMVLENGEIVDYEGDRSFDSLVEFVNKQTGSSSEDEEEYVEEEDTETEEEDGKEKDEL